MKYSCLPLLLIISSTGCRDDKSQDHAVSESSTGQSIYMSLTDPVPTYDVELTWTHYDPFWRSNGSLVKAEYYLEKQSMGSGSAGFANVLSAIGKLPTGTRILMYPSYQVPTQLHENSPPADFPFAEEGFRRLMGIVRQNKLVLIHSPRDSSGVLDAYFTTPFQLP